MFSIEAMMEYAKPGSGIPMEKLLDEFANIAVRTKRANFYITKNVRSGKWRVQLVGVRKSFIGDDLRELVIQAGEYVFKNTVESVGVKMLKKESNPS